MTHVGNQATTRFVVDGSSVAHVGRQQPAFERLLAVRDALTKAYPNAEVYIICDATLRSRLRGAPGEQEYEQLIASGTVLQAPVGHPPRPVKLENFFIQLLRQAGPSGLPLAAIANALRDTSEAMAWLETVAGPQRPRRLVGYLTSMARLFEVFGPTPDLRARLRTSSASYSLGQPDERSSGASEVDSRGKASATRANGRAG